MKNTFKSIFKKTVSLILVLTMLIGASSSVFALNRIEKKTLNYVSFGDSITNGFGLTGYDSQYYGFNTMAYGCYPDLLAKAISGAKYSDAEAQYQKTGTPVVHSEPYHYEGKEYDVDLTQLAISGSRLEDLAFYFNFDTKTASAEKGSDKAFLKDALNWGKSKDGYIDIFEWETHKAEWKNQFEYGDYNTWDSYVSDRFARWGGTSYYNFSNDRTEAVSGVIEYIQNAVKDADIISMSIGNADFGVYGMGRLEDALSSDPNEAEHAKELDAKALIESRIENKKIVEFLENIVSSLESVLTSALGSDENDIAEVLGIDDPTLPFKVYEYTFASYLTSYVESLRAISRLNTKDNLDLILIGMINPFLGITFDIPKNVLGMELKIDAESLLNQVIALFNTYLCAVPVVLQAQGECENISFYFTNPGEIELFASAMTYEKLRSSEYERYRSELLKEVYETYLASRLSDADAKTKLSDIEKYEKFVAAAESYQASKASLNDLFNAAEEAGDVISSAKASEYASYLALEYAVLEAVINGHIGGNGIGYLIGAKNGSDILNAAMTSVKNKDLIMQKAAALVAGVDKDGIPSEDLEKFNTIITAYEALQAAENEARIYLIPGGSEDPQISLNAEISESLLLFFGYASIGNNISNHPNLKGHQEAFEQIWESYPNYHGYPIDGVRPADRILSVTEPLVNTAVSLIYQFAEGIGLFGNYNSLTPSGEQVLNKMLELADGMLEMIVDRQTLYDATHFTYELSDDNYYVALGGSTLRSVGVIDKNVNYAKMLVSSLGLNNDQYKLITSPFLSWQDAGKLIKENKDEIQKADLITYHLDSIGFIESTLRAFIFDEDISKYLDNNIVSLTDTLLGRIVMLLKDDLSDPDFIEFAGEEFAGAALNVLMESGIIEKIIAGLASDENNNALILVGALAKLLGINEDVQIFSLLSTITNTLTAYVGQVMISLNEAKKGIANIDFDVYMPYVRKIAYILTASVIEKYKGIDLIREYNSDAALAVLGVSNPLPGLVITSGETTIEVGKFVDYAVKAANVYATARILRCDDSEDKLAYIDLSDVQHGKGNVNIDLGNKIMAILKLPIVIGDLCVTEVGQKQIADSIYESMNIIEKKNEDVMAAPRMLLGSISKALVAAKTEVADADETEPEEKTIAPVSDSEIISDMPLLIAPAPKQKIVFSDVDENQWYAEGVNYCSEKSLILGYEDGTFDPDAFTSRGMVVTLLWRLAGEPYVNYAMSFKDVAEDAWYAEAVRWAQAEKIVNGFSDTQFGPDEYVTREELATMLYNYAKHEKKGFSGDWMFLLQYKDAVSISSFADEAVHWMSMKKILQGDENGYFVPQGTATRAELATTFMRYCKASEE